MLSIFTNLLGDLFQFLTHKPVEIGTDYINELPNEILTQILEYLSTEEKFESRLVCKKLKTLIDEKVSFHANLSDESDESYQAVLYIRRVTSLSIQNYSPPYTPIKNLSCLKSLEVGVGVSKLAVHDIFTRAVNLYKLHVIVHHHEKNYIASKCVFPALKNIKYLSVGYDSEWTWKQQTQCPKAWNKVLDEQMPNVERLEICYTEGYKFPLVVGFDFFRLMASKPKLQKLLTFQLCMNKRYHHVYDGDDEPNGPNRIFLLEPSVCEGLQKLTRITELQATVHEKDEKFWKIILSGQLQLESLRLLCEWKYSHSTKGFPMSMVLPVLSKSKESLNTIDLDIDTWRNGDLDMEIFSQLTSLQKLTLRVWKANYDKFRRYEALLNSSVINCSAVIKPALRRLDMIGFRFSEGDANDVISKIAKLDLEKVEVKTGDLPVWENFEERLQKMGIDKSVQISTSYWNSNPKFNKHGIKSCFATFEFVPRFIQV